MNLNLEYMLSFYKDIASLNEEKEITLVQHIETGELFVKKRIDVYNYDVYDRLKKSQIANVPRIYEMMQDEDQLYIIEEYIHGHSLVEVLDEAENGLDEEEVIDYSLQLCKILIDLNELNPPIVHRDINPSNIMISSDGKIKLIDFNIAKETDSSKNRDTQLFGTTSFAAPEQYGFGSSDVRTDIYGFGATINYLLTKHSINDGISDSIFKKIITKCTQISPKKRYNNFNELYRDLLKVSRKKHSKTKSEKGGLYQEKDYLPPGFRTGNIWKMILASLYYIFCILICFVGNEKTNTSIPTAIFLFVMLIVPIVILANYKNVLRFVPHFTEHRIINLILNIIFTAIVDFVILCIIIVIFNLLGLV